MYCRGRSPARNCDCTQPDTVTRSADRQSVLIQRSSMTVVIHFFERFITALKGERSATAAFEREERFVRIVSQPIRAEATSDVLLPFRESQLPIWLRISDRTALSAEWKTGPGAFRTMLSAQHICRTRISLLEDSAHAVKTAGFLQSRLIVSQSRVGYFTSTTGKRVNSQYSC